MELGKTHCARPWLAGGLVVATAARDEHARSELQAALDTL
jgi:hypothetical protein